MMTRDDINLILLLILTGVWAFIIDDDDIIISIDMSY